MHGEHKNRPNPGSDNALPIDSPSQRGLSAIQHKASTGGSTMPMKSSYNLLFRIFPGAGHFTSSRGSRERAPPLRSHFQSALEFFERFLGLV